MFPRAAGGQHNAEIERRVDLDFQGNGLAAGGRGLAGVEDAVVAGDQTAQGGGVHLIGVAENVDHARLGPFGAGVPDVLGERVTGDRGTVAIPPVGDPQRHAHPPARHRRPVRAISPNPWVWDFCSIPTAAGDKAALDPCVVPVHDYRSWKANMPRDRELGLSPGRVDNGH